MFARRQWGGVRGSFNLEVPNESPIIPLWVVQVMSPGRSPAAARGGNEIPSPPSSTYTEYRESGKLLRFKGAELSYGLSPSLQECLSTLALSEFLLPLDLLPFLPYLVILFCAATKLAAASPPMLPLVYFFSISILYTDNFFPVLVFITLFTSIVLLEPTRSPNPKRATGF